MPDDADEAPRLKQKGGWALRRPKFTPPECLWGVLPGRAHQAYAKALPHD